MSPFFKNMRGQLGSFAYASRFSHREAFGIHKPAAKSLLKKIQISARVAATDVEEPSELPLAPSEDEEEFRPSQTYPADDKPLLGLSIFYV